ncbi:hypothetical protein D3C73_1595430 [compost metagenome]
MRASYCLGWVIDANSTFWIAAAVSDTELTFRSLPATPTVPWMRTAVVLRSPASAGSASRKKAAVPVAAQVPCQT